MKSGRIVIITALLLIAAACARVPITGRKQLNLLPRDRMMSMSLNQYDQFLQQNRGAILKPSENKDARMVQNVGRNIASSVEDYLRDNGYKEQAQSFEWEFTLVEQDVVNAWAMPGGKTAVYTGILPVTKNREGLAVVMGHEVAHAVARHGNERMSQQLAVALGGISLAVAMRNKPQITQNLFMAAYGLGSQVGVLLPFSRKHESEADRMGLVFMAMAGYDPREAPNFWKRMSEAGGKAPPEFLSTHPSHETRIEDLKRYMPEAMRYYRRKQESM